MKDVINDATVLDVRTPAEFHAGHFPGAVNIPVDEIAAHIGELKKTGMPIVAYCHSGARSGLAVSILKQNGLQEVYNAGGLNDILQHVK
jgi:phage shock protein E